jgi:hypothetical protein
MDDEERGPYRAEERAGAWVVADDTGRAHCSCGSRENAEQYAALMNEAYRRGRREGYRAARRT